MVVVASLALVLAFSVVRESTGGETVHRLVVEMVTSNADNNNAIRRERSWAEEVFEKVLTHTQHGLKGVYVSLCLKLC